MGAKYGSSYPKSRKEATTPSINTYKASDGWLQMCGASYNIYYDRIMKTIGREDLVGDPRYNDLQTIQDSGDNIKVIQIIEEAMIKKTCAEWIPLFRAADVPCEKCYTFEDILEDEQAWASKSIEKIHYPNGHEGIVVANPIRMSSIGDPEYVLSQRIGAHTKEVLCNEYNISEEELNKLVESGVVKI
jgi:crotonobetainyl-CoA:carnitine CoA-transferase CaiB-like acyl-CoA transferase